MTRLASADEDFRQRALKPRDAWWTVLVIDPFAVPVLRVLVRVEWVTPLLLTTVGSAFGVAAVGAFFTGHLLTGALLFEARFFFDCLDGKLARLREMSSRRGAFVDLSSDVVLISASIAGLGWYLAHDAPHRQYVPLGLSAACAFACLTLFWLILYDLDHPDVATPSGRAVIPAGLDGWLARHRLDRLPRTVEVETTLLFVAPLIGSGILLRVSFWLATIFYVLAVLRTYVRLVRATGTGAPR